MEETYLFLFVDYDYYGDTSEEEEEETRSNSKAEELKDLKTRLHYITRMASSQHSSRKSTTHKHWIKKCPWYRCKYHQKRVASNKKQ